MYSPKVTNAVLDDFEMRNGWRPVEHSIAQVDEFNEYIESLIQFESNERTKYIDFKPSVRLTERRKAEIKRWVENEQFMCFASSSYYETRYVYVCDEANNVVRFKNRKSQEVFDSILEPFDERQDPIQIFVIKARQEGISTKVAFKFQHRTLFTPYTQCVQASVTDNNTQLLMRIFNTAMAKLPFWLTPRQISTKMSSPQWANGSIISIQSGTQKFGIGQGWTPTNIHISELADLPNPKKTLEEGLFRATHATSKLFMLLEGTGGDSTSWQAEKWRYYKANWGKGGRFMTVFIPWPCMPDLYPTKDWLRQNPVPEGFSPAEPTRRMSHRAELFIRSTDYLAKVMGARWTMPLEQMWFWECGYREAEQTHTLKVFLSQLPCTDDEALQSKHDRAFSSETIEVISEARERTYQAYAVTGDSVLIGQSDEPYWPEDHRIDYSKERIPLRWKNKNGQYTDWELIPLLPFDDSEDQSAFNTLLVFHPPREGCDYSIGIDTADGLGNPDEDRSLLSVAINRSGNQRDEQVAEFVSNNVNSAQMVSVAACVATWYGQKRADRFGTRDPRGVKFCIEQRERPGDDCQHQLKLMGFSYHHVMVRYDGKKVDQNAGSRLGFYSSEWSRSMYLGRFVDAVTNGWYKPNSPMLVRQLSQWVRKIKAGGGKSKLDHESGKHDDNITAAALSYFTRHAFDVLTERQQMKYAVQTEDQILTREFIEAPVANTMVI